MAVNNQEVSGESTNALGEAFLKAGKAINDTTELHQKLTGIDSPLANGLFLTLILMIVVVFILFIYVLHKST